MTMTKEKDMTMEQQYNMVTVKNIARFFIDSGVMFQLVTIEKEDEIIKKFQRLLPFDLVNENIENIFDAVDEIEVNINEGWVRFYNTYEEILQYDVHRALAFIIASIN